MLQSAVSLVEIMAIIIKNDEEIELMRKAGEILAKVHEELGAFLKAGISTKDVDTYCEERIRSYGCIPSFLGYAGYPASVCVSVNEEVIHGIPRSDKILKEGDLVSLDTGVIYKGYQSDAARTHIIGKTTKEREELVRVTEGSFFAGLKEAREGRNLYDISAAIDAYIRPHGFGIVRDFTGHGIGKDMHEDPYIPNYRKLTRGPKLKRGMTLAVEPMVNLGTWKVGILEDEWTVVTLDMKASAHYENTILITDGDPEILSLKG